MNLTIEVPDEHIPALKAKAAAEGLTLEGWFRKLAEQESACENPLQTAAEIVLEHLRQVPSEVLETMPEDGASQHDHYIYGWPKRQA